MNISRRSLFKGLLGLPLVAALGKQAGLAPRNAATAKFFPEIWNAHPTVIDVFGGPADVWNTHSTVDDVFGCDLWGSTLTTADINSEEFGFTISITAEYERDG